MNGYRLVRAGRDYPLGSSSIDPNLYAFVQSNGLGKRRPGVIRCGTCHVYSTVWGWRQVSGFREAHLGHDYSLRMK